jgi:hypothetical protein
MTTAEFYQKFANLPLKERVKILEKNDENIPLTFYWLNFQINLLDDTMRPKKIKMKKLLELAEKHFYIKNI